jgi:hypothetical protein
MKTATRGATGIDYGSIQKTARKGRRTKIPASVPIDIDSSKKTAGRPKGILKIANSHHIDAPTITFEGSAVEEGTDFTPSATIFIRSSQSNSPSSTRRDVTPSESERVKWDRILLGAARNFRELH